MRKTVLAIVRGQGGRVAVRARLVAGLLVGLLAGFAALPAAPRRRRRVGVWAPGSPCPAMLASRPIG
jgi:hypothetical protein